ncbi:MAG: type II 3-dehydroquinate dehydratase [Candidatus Gygaella obscura]|nr:type II 3-dehydroquinate dehydratase [Candidatus Gygaella obscura]
MKNIKEKKILILHGPNLDLLGKREPDIYGSFTLEQINDQIKQQAEQLNLSVEIINSNHEGEIVDAIGNSSKEFDAIVINPAAYTHTSVAIRDAISACGLPTVEVHLSNIYAREEFRKTSLISPVAKGQIAGFGIQSYLLGLKAAANLIQK